MARLIVQGFRLGRILLFARFSLPRYSFLFFFSSLLSLLSLVVYPRFHESRLGRARFTSTIIPVPEFSLPASISFHPPPWHDSCRTFVIMRGESCVSHRGIIRKCFPRHSRPFLLCFLFSSYFPSLLLFFPFCFFSFYLFRPPRYMRVNIRV